MSIFICTTAGVDLDMVRLGNAADYSCLNELIQGNVFGIVHAGGILPKLFDIFVRRMADPVPVTDLLLLFVPVVIIIKVQMPFWRKARIIILFYVGLVACIARATRLTFGLYAGVPSDITCKLAQYPSAFLMIF